MWAEFKTKGAHLGRFCQGSLKSKHENTITKPEMTGVPKEPKDTGIFLEGLRFGREDH